jgi:signal transduction histidine kinase
MGREAWLVDIPAWLEQISLFGIILTDRLFNVRLWNQSLEQQTGLPAAQAIGRRLPELCSTADQAGLDALLARSLGGEQLRLAGPQRDVTLLGQARLASIGPLVVGDEVVGIIGMTEHPAPAQPGEGRASSPMSDDFLRVAAHELRNPLTAIVGQSQLLQRRLVREATDTRNLRSAEVIGEQAKRLNSLIVSLFEAVRITNGGLKLNRVPVDLCSLVQRMVERAGAGTNRHQLQLLECPERLMVLADTTWIECALRHLLENAIKYIPQGGLVEVRLVREHQTARIAVCDEGIGIAPIDQPKLFQRFFRAENARKHEVSGLGTGLSTVQEIITRHGGRVYAESTEGQGSTFTIQLPLWNEAIYV